MSDHPQSTPPPPPAHLAWEDDAAFRHAFLFRFQPEDQAALRRVGAMLYEYALEFAKYEPGVAEAAVRAELRSAAQDLRVVEGFLTMLQVEADDTELGASAVALTQIAGAYAHE